MSDVHQRQNTDTRQSQTQGTMWLYSRSRGEATLAILFLTTGLQGRLATDRNWGGSVDGHWEILKDLCNLWSLENIAFIYSTYPEEGE